MRPDMELILLGLEAVQVGLLIAIVVEVHLLRRVTETQRPIRNEDMFGG
jgi:hypothetical protein